MTNIHSQLVRRVGSLLSIGLLLTGSAIAQSDGPSQSGARRDGMRFVPNVQAQFHDLTERADALGLHIGNSPDPSMCKHYQGMVRAEGADGTPFFLVTRSGNIPSNGNGVVCDDSDGETDNGHLIVFRLDSRDRDGERLRSNRLRRGVRIDSTTPVSLDRATIHFTFIGGDPTNADPAKHPGLVLRDGPNNLPPRVYQHPGGMQLVGNILAVPLEGRRAQDDYESAAEPTAVHFYDVSNPEAPVFKSQFIPKNSAGQTLSVAGTLGLTRLPDGHYLMVLTGGSSNASWFFYKSNGTDLSSDTLSWVQVDTPVAPDTVDGHQTLNFLREGDINGDLYLAGARGRLAANRDKLDLYQIVCVSPEGGESPNCNPGDVVERIDINVNKNVTPRPSTGGNELLNLAAASTFYISPSGELLFYATEHDNDGPDETVKVGEWRHVDVVRPNSPTLRPSAKFEGPFEVNEGSSIDLTGAGRPPVTRAFLELFTLPLLPPAYLTADYKDRDRDDFDDLVAFEAASLHADSGHSWVWFAPQGCSIQAINRAVGTETVVGIKTLTNATTPQVDADLHLIMNDAGTGNMFENIDRIIFGNDCGTYYNAPINLFWDLDRNGIFEVQGNTATFSAAQLDGPTLVQVPVEARHSLGGPAGTADAFVTIKNVAPQFSEFSVVDSSGSPINSTVPWVLTGLPVGIAASFTDPGILDHQTALISWGDGTKEPNSAFNTFDEAFGDGVGGVLHAHVFSAAGTYAVQLKINDDDGDSDVRSANVRVLSPEQAVIELIVMIDTAIAATTDTRVVAELQKARHFLTGSNTNSSNGALQKIRTGENEAAATFALTSAAALQKAAEGGADVALLITLLEQVATALRA